MSSGDAYHRPEPTYRSELTLVGRGTPMGELLRRYWHPVGLTADACETPKMVRVLGEDLVLFRDRSGRPGLVYPRCVHRGASLFYGKTEEHGIRCCYHGWLFDVSGRCLEQPGRPDTGKPVPGNVRQPVYPLEERYGLIFAYLGPPERKPVLPRYNILETLEPGEHIEADDSSIGSGGPVIVPCNWLQHFENVMDPIHVPVLHGSFSGTQFTDSMNLFPDVTFTSMTDRVRSLQLRKLPSGQVHQRITEAVLPTVRAVANPRADKDGPCSLVGWVLPLDDTHFRIYSAGRVTSPGALKQIRSRFNGKLWAELTEAEHQRFPGDYEAHISQGAITFHSEEHLVRSDRGIVLLRNLLKRQVDAVARGEDPAGVAFDSAGVLVELAAGTITLNGMLPHAEE
ncbi:MAG TPA: Rieske 2Fe-2S domain-containing protein [Steroidobacteraceae bacterium]|nr:Rieske 2Fe-2S domain-containing protein [Steroidobacteraceae bacterium]